MRATTLINATSVLAATCSARDAKVKVTSNSSSTSDTCLCLPSDSCWPSTSQWDALNSTVGGRLIKTVPIGSVCHDPNYDEAACAELQNNWTAPQIHEPDATSVMTPYFANQSCDPFTDRTTPCEFGNYARYAVNVTNTNDVIAAVNFAREKDVRLVVRNTGHDFLGRSTGAGSLNIWTHYLKNTSTVQWSDSSYTGTALKFGAGILGYEAIEYARTLNRTVLTGECPTVGVAGGFTQGGGHGVLSSVFGLAADQVLEWEVVTADGKTAIANRKTNSDLFWAMSGGGGGTYAVATAVTVRSYPDASIAGWGLQATAAHTTQDVWFDRIAAFHALLPDLVAKGAMITYYFTNAFLVINPVTLFNGTVADINEMMEPWVSTLNSNSIYFTNSSAQSANTYDHYNTWNGPLPYGHVEVSAYQFGSRLITSDVIANNNTDLTDALRYIVNNGGMAVGSALKATPPSGVKTTDNAVHAAWRNTTIQLQITTTWNNTPSAWDQMLEDQQTMTNDFVPRLHDVAPNTGSYMNEADFRLASWKEDFFGANYDALNTIKNRWDPSHLFWSLKTVGSDYWTVDETTGRMCRA